MFPLERNKRLLVNKTKRIKVTKTNPIAKYDMEMHLKHFGRVNVVAKKRNSLNKVNQHVDIFWKCNTKKAKNV